MAAESVRSRAFRMVVDYGGSPASQAVPRVMGSLGVLLDTIIVRSVLVTALTLDIGRHIWWPSKLANPESRAVTDGT